MIDCLGNAAFSYVNKGGNYAHDPNDLLRSNASERCAGSDSIREPTDGVIKQLLSGPFTFVEEVDQLLRGVRSEI